MKLTELLENDPYRNSYVTFYEIIGRRENGSYVVRANSKAEANNVVRKLNSNYTRIRSTLVREFLGDDINDPGYKETLDSLGKEIGSYVHWEEGT